ncbi:hypothetical protein DXT99_11525 [Pontibacter diazotrophicus]|uniref:Alpha-1,2-fucosyltransferase n=1 Tax=Pontibacter diazotrophicus TaxID=1400979 RepID=A0A3D8LBZ6_9BACT|nr:hypothetical protein DXT99_11525 [Pontibacter diazotrophicus]
MCNRLWSYVPFISFCLKAEKELLILHFEEYYDLFENLQAIPGIQVQKHHPFKKRGLGKKLLYHFTQKLPQGVLRFSNVYADKDFWENERWNAVLSGQKTRIFFQSGVDHIQKNLLLPEYHEQVRLLFKPKQTLAHNIDQQIDAQRAKHEVIVGVHIRRNDYRSFKGGAYYFQDATYYKYMAALEKELNTMGKSVVFLLCSDEKVDPAHFEGLNTFQVSSSVDVEELYALALTDYIMGAPSTFSMWASFYGEVPLRILQFKDEKIALHQFSVIISQDVFEDGKRFVHNDRLASSEC